MRQSFIAMEKAIEEGIEAPNRAQIDNLTREKIEQKEANMQNNATSLSKINFQENTIQTLLEERDYYKNQLEKTIQENNKQRIDLGHKTIELRNYKNKEDNYIEKIKDLISKVQSAEDMEQYYRETQDENMQIIRELT